ncbi:hypothetical protein C8R46DRAFT_642643 [Mycena filopes]|nr:hypothetical protein C8R46DRAFT_642643 [Mycena filopes]
MAVVPLIRLVALSVVLAFAVIVLGLSAALTATTEKYLGGYFEFAALAIATALITLLTVPVMIALEFMRPGAVFTSMIVVELSWLFIVWVLWLATAADAAQEGQIFISNCGDYLDGTVKTACQEAQAVQAFSFLNWIILMIYTIFILVLAITAASRKHTGVWKSSVADAPFFTPGNESSIPPVTSQPESAPAGSLGHGPHSVSTGGYEAQHITTGAGGTGPASVQAGTVHQV